MSRQLLHTPEGVRDIYAEECARKMAVQNKIQKIFHLYGYQNIETPTYEFFDIFKKERDKTGLYIAEGYKLCAEACGRVSVAYAWQACW